ncbi:MAG TPA: hypothetical protein VHB97_21770 [Polyangia bacterium]|nr:hypothetical protein [Polyangia bacterium]
MFTRIGFIGVLALAIVGCASSSEEQRSSTGRDNAARERSFQFSGGDTLLQRATFDLGCAAEQMQAQVLQRVGMFQVASSVGVRGCGRQATYMRSAGTSGTWVLNGPVMSFQPPPPQSPPQQ